MNFNEYQRRAAETAIYPHAGEQDIVALSYLGLGLGEAGEVQGKIKKILRDSNGVIEDQHKVHIGKELGDLLWYVAMLATEIGLPMDVLAIQNLSKLSDRKQRGVLVGSGDER